ncbi:MAG TPA: FAD-dependent oxidoreductase, partial [Polyangiaceae bacterium]
RARHLGSAAARRLAPALRHDRVVGGVVYYDAQVDDARFVLDVVRTAASFGAHVVSRARVVALREELGRISGAQIHLLDSDDEIVVRARAVVSATGVWTEELSAMIDAAGPRLQPSKGVHLVVDRGAIDSATALIIPTATSVLFVLPWGGHWIVGTTDTAWDFDPGRPVATSSDIDFLLGELNAVLARPIGKDAVESVYVGLRPLLGGHASSTTKLSREHAVAVPRPGFALVSGGKFTTYRVMARDALDAALDSAGIAAGPCRTDAVPIAGADGYLAAVARSAEFADERRLPAVEIVRLLHRYGGLVEEILAVEGVADPWVGLTGAPGYLRAEVGYAVSHEGARHLDDVLVRRTRMAMETTDRGLGAATEVAMVIAPLLGWDRSTIEEEIAAYRAAVQAEKRAEQYPDDAAAEAARLGFREAT